ncbi:MAG: hypothetical protein HY313_03815 [Acidobacteria bacterium]|nr:hypothetical protein [Acidobacteriota bacterium]
MWVGAIDGLLRFKDGEWQVFTTDNSPLPHNWVWSISTQPDSTVWVGTENGLARIQEGQWQIFTERGKP